MNVLIIGGSGYIGKRLVDRLGAHGGFQVSVLSRIGRAPSVPKNAGVRIVKGDLLDPESISRAIERGSQVVNLAYMWNADAAQNIAATKTLASACTRNGVKRLLHCSTASVFGRSPEMWISEKTPCNPLSPYGIAKLKIEKIVDIAGRDIDTVTIRPTAVFGPASNTLSALAQDIYSGSRLKNYLRLCLFNKRRMNLVHLDNVVAAVMFFLEKKDDIGGGKFIVSDDDDHSNNFIEVSRALQIPGCVPPLRLPLVPIPPLFLTAALAALGRDNINPMRNFSSQKLLDAGYKRVVSFSNGLRDYAAWFQSSVSSGSGDTVIGEKGLKNL
jgi:nucleoside-diphosphate-sugar epimerase